MHETPSLDSARQYQARNEQLATRCAALTDTVRDTEQWIDNNPDLVSPATALTLHAELRKAAQTFGKCAVAATRKMCVGVFGPSQAGKSYLISSLASPKDGALLADFAGERIDFIKEINPAGNRESTGLVTRFTTTAPAGAPAGSPVHLRMLTEADIVCILANTYYADCIHEEEPSPEEVLPMLRELDGRKGTAQGMPLAHAQDIREYVSRHFAPQARVIMLKNVGYWEKMQELAPQLSIEDRARLFACLWHNEADFTRLYIRLAEALRAIGNPDEAWCPLTVLRPREQSIIDVAQLKNLQSEDGDRITVTGSAGASCALTRSVITALTAELTIYMPEKPDAFFDYTDLLDFPGYRSRLAVPNLSVALQNGELDTFFLRGKVSFLFHRYCEERELTSMLLCIGDGPQETGPVLRPAVKAWIDAAHGNTAQARAGVEPALFVILTKIDTIFERKAGTPSIEGRWNARLYSSLLEPFNSGDDPWPENWDGKPFNNVFLLRNPKIRCAIFAHNPANETEETGIAEDSATFVPTVRQDFEKSESVQAHVHTPPQAWDAIMTCNDGGVSYLRDHLRPLCNPDLKRNQISTVVKQWQSRLHTQLFHYWVNDDKEEERRTKALRTQRVAGHFANIIKNELFGDFLSALQVHDHNLYALYKKIEQERLQQPDATPDMENAHSSMLEEDILASVFGADLEPTSAALAPEESAAPQRMDSAERFATLALEGWTTQLQNFAASEAAQNYFGFPGAELRFFVDELICAFHRHGLLRQLTDELRTAADYGNMQQDHILWKQASITSYYINTFVDWLGFDPATCDTLARTVRVREQQSVVFTPPEAIQGIVTIGEKPTDYAKNHAIDWLKALAASIDANVDFAGGISFNKEENTKLGKLLSAFSPAEDV